MVFIFIYTIVESAFINLKEGLIPEVSTMELVLQLDRNEITLSGIIFKSSQHILYRLNLYLIYNFHDVFHYYDYGNHL